MNLKKCQECKNEYQNQDGKKSPVCPYCGSHFWTLASAQDPSSKENTTREVQSNYPPHLEEIPGSRDIDRLIAAQNKNTQDLIRAQNRTTHAVRAFVRFLFIQLSGLTLVYFTWNLSAISIDPNECARYGDKCEGNLFFQVLAILIWIGTVIFSSRAGWSELEKSDI